MVPIRKADEPRALNALIAGITPDGGTQIAPALTVRAAADRRGEPRAQPPRRAIDVSAIITRALTAAGLIKNSDAI